MTNLNGHGSVLSLEEEASRRMLEQCEAHDADTIRARRPSDRGSLLCRPAPLHALSSEIRVFIEAAAKAIGCAPEMVLGPVLATMSAAIGNSRRIHLSEWWSEPSTLWTIIVGPPSSSKSPAIQLATAPLRTRQLRGISPKSWGTQPSESGNGAQDPSDLPRLVISDTTLEAVADRLRTNPRGLLLAADEGATWLGGFNRYHKGQKIDQNAWCTIWQAGEAIIDRKTGTPKSILIPFANVSVATGLQTDLLNRFLNDHAFESGFAVRIILISPRARTKKWSNQANVDPEPLALYETIINELVDLDCDVDEHGNHSPRIIRLSKQAEQAWGVWYDDLQERLANASGRKNQLLGKCASHVARLALILHCVRTLRPDPTCNPEIELADVEAAIELGEWLTEETLRVWHLMSESKEDQKTRESLALVARISEENGGSVSVRQLMRQSSKFKNATEWRDLLNGWAESGLGKWIHSPTTGDVGAPAGARFQLCETEDLPALTQSMD